MLCPTKEGILDELTNLHLFEGTMVIINKVDTLRRITVKALEDLWLADIRECYDANEGLFAIDQAKKDIFVIMEFAISYPKPSEMNFLRRIRQYALHKDITLIVTSQRINREFVKLMFEVGVRKILLKSYNIHQYSEKLRDVILSSKSRMPYLKAG